jgi:hypothetical protein
MKLPITVISLIENLLLLLPALLAVAYVTVAERKTMASMQRRLGPNAVGQIQISLFKRSYHNFAYSPNEEKFISDLYLNRKAPVIPFKDNVISVCEDLNSSDAMNTFFKSLKGKGGIYMFSYKTDPNIYYIGRAKDFNKRLKAHLNINLKDRFHVFANTMG